MKPTIRDNKGRRIETPILPLDPVLLGRLVSDISEDCEDEVLELLDELGLFG